MRPNNRLRPRSLFPRINRPSFFIPCLLVLLGAAGVFAADSLPLAGQWRFALDRNDAGTNEHWFTNTLPDKIQLPGILEAQGYGDEISISTPWVLSLYDHFWFLRADYAADTNAGAIKVPFLCQPPRHYLGAAWYQTDFEIPPAWNGKRLALFLERPHWKSTVWLDDQEIGSDLSLCTPHEYELGVVTAAPGPKTAGGTRSPSLVTPGRHCLTIRVDNRLILPYRPDAHSVSDSLDNAWNGIVGKLELRATPPVWIDNPQVFPHLETSSLTIKGKIANLTGRPGTDKLELSVSATPGDGKTLAAKTVIVTWSTNGGAFEVTLETGTAVQPWDEFQPHLYTLNFHLKKQDGEMRSQPASRSLIFGLRDFHAQGNEFILNGHPVYLRGTHFGGDFPLTGYPPTDVESWRKIMLTCMNYGLNHLRFHSWCPPEAAFAAADELGFYLQVECGMWNDFTPGGEMEKMLYTETDRILRAYGNHPSFLLLSASNEAHGRWQQVLPQWVEYYRAADPRHLYTPDTGWVAIDTPGPVTGADYLVAGRIGTSRIRGESGWFGGGYEDSLRGINVPVVAHELGQWCAYPDYGVITKFTGFMRPGNFEIFRDSAAAHGLFASGEAGAPAHPVNTDFALASGRFQLECYKEEIEANLRTPGLAGFQLLDLHDYTGQGTALVGLLDPFWESKGYAGPDEFKEFCNSTVPLARLTQRTFTTADAFSVPVEAAHYGKAPLEVATAGWQIISPANEVMAHGEFAATNIPIGKNFPLGTITADLSRLPAPACYGLRVIIGQASHFPGGRLGVLPPFINTWNFWLYPAIQPAAPAGANVLETSSFPAAQAALAQGKNVLFQPRNSELDWNSPPLARVPIFWNALMGPTWSRMLGLWCDTNSPALAEFPTAANCDWQWTGLLRNTRAINLNRLPPGLTPIVSAIDDWNRNDKLGLIFEAKTGPGKLLVCAADLSAKAGPVAQQLRHSLLDYLAGGQCQPRTEISPAELASLRFDTRIMRKLHAAAIADGSPAWELVDGDPNTFWSSADARGKGPQPPHVIQISFPDPVAMNGLVLMPRQNQREHQGDVREYQIELSNDGTDWREIAAGQLPSTFAEQKILFSQTVSARYIKFTARSGFGNDASAALAELAVIYAGPELPEDAAGNIEYQNIRTASPDIDAGNAPGKPRKR